MHRDDRHTGTIALIEGREVSLARWVEHVRGGLCIATFTWTDGEMRYATEEEWETGVAAYHARARAEGLVTTASPKEDKLALFTSLFKGRSDVFTLGYRKRDGGIGYFPVCANKFKPGVCPRANGKRVPCADCSHRVFRPLDDAALLAHFQGRSEKFHDVIGLYVLDEQCNTSVLVADFDGTGWQEEATAYRDAAADMGIQTSVERSRSGNGGHVWTFFIEPVPASLARDLGFAILTSAMRRTSTLKLDAYDRLFPAQSTIPTGGFGNLIALPFQGRAMRAGNTVFVNERFEPYPDQWQFLSRVQKVSRAAAEEVVAAHKPVEGPLGFDRAKARSHHRDEHFPQPALASPAPTLTPAASRTERALGTEDFPTPLVVHKRGMLNIPKEGLSAAGRAAIIRLAAFGNPEFYRAQAMHLSVRGKPRIICRADETATTIEVPRGCEDKLVDLLTEAGVTFSIVDERPQHDALDVTLNGTLRPEQAPCAEALLAHEIGVLEAPTGFGKTFIGAHLIATLSMRTLVIVPNTALLRQWRERLGELLTIRDPRPVPKTASGRPSRRKRPVIGQIGGGKHAPSGLVDIAIAKSLITKGEIEGTTAVESIVENYDLVIVDECHHSAAPTLEAVLRAASARRVYGLSATPRRDDGLERIVYMYCGPLRYRVDPKQQAAAQGIARHLIPRLTRIRLPEVEPGSSFNQIVDALCGNARRNRLIVDDVRAALAAGRTPLVLTKRREHAALLAKALDDGTCPVVLLTGSGTNKEKRERLEALEHIPDGKRFIVVATGSYVGEGFDEPRLDALFVAAPISCETVVTQYSGRLHREHAGKSDVVVYDYIDATVPMLDRMYQRRLKTYAKLGYTVEENGDGSPQDDASRLLDAHTYAAAFAADLAQASTCVDLAAPYTTAKRISFVAPLLKEMVERGVPVQVTLYAASSDVQQQHAARAAKLLRDAGCTVTIGSRRPPALAVFDKRIVWYGSLPLLAFPKAEDCSLRLVDTELAAELLARLDKDGATS